MMMGARAAPQQSLLAPAQHVLLLPVAAERRHDRQQHRYELAPYCSALKYHMADYVAGAQVQ
jgi:hypothetical protein